MTLPRDEETRLAEWFQYVPDQLKSSEGVRAGTKSFQRETRGGLQELIADRRAQGRDRLADHYEDLMQQVDSVKTKLWFCEYTGSLRSFGDAADISHTGTFPSDYKIVRWIGRIIGIAALVTVLYYGYRVVEEFRGYLESYSQTIEATIEQTNK
jgi:hypothetical protein